MTTPTRNAQYSSGAEGADGTEPGARAQLVLGELVGGKSTLTELACATPGVRARQSRTKGARLTVENRLYECANGWALAARRGAPLHLADADTWEIATLTPERFTLGESAGWVDEAQLARLVELLAGWFDEEAVTNA